MMIDREKVIEALQYLISGECTDTQFDYLDEIEAAIAMLKEQEPVEPKEKDYVWRCGKCDEYLTAIENHRIRFCLYCGKAVKWE